MEGTAPQNPARGGAGKMLHGDGCVRWEEIPRVSPPPSIPGRAPGHRVPAGMSYSSQAHTQGSYGNRGVIPLPKAPLKLRVPPSFPIHAVFTEAQKGGKKIKKERKKRKKKKVTTKTKPPRSEFLEEKSIKGH